MTGPIVVAGALANKPYNGGEAWVRLSWVKGLKRLGHAVELVEEIHPSTLIGPDGHPAALADSVNLAYFQRVVREFGLEGSASLIVTGTDETVGRAVAELRDLAADSPLLVNISGHLAAPWLMPRFRRRAYIDIDPGFTQFWLDQGIEGHRVDGHDRLYTIAANIGTAHCSIPTVGREWRTVLQPVVLEDWPVRPPAGDDAPFTTVSSWRGAFGPITHRGHRFGLKVHEFRKLLDLPGRVPAELEIALDIHPGDAADLAALEDGGWRVVDPRTVARDPASFREYVAASAGELSAAQGIYVDTNSGWFSDRTVRYLATGRPAIIQDTGFGETVPAGVGLHAFRTPDDAAAAVRRVLQDYDAERQAARQIAERYFDSDRVLGDFLDHALDGSSAGQDRGAHGPSARERTGPNQPRTRDRLSVLVAGRLAAAPGQGGAAWAVLQYLIGLRELGHEVRFVEPLDHGAEVGGQGLAGSPQGRYFRRVLESFGLEEDGALLGNGAGTMGATPETVRRWADDADVLINLSGVLTDPSLLEPIPVRLYLDMDPAFTQLWHAQEGIDMGLGLHTHHATVGLALANGRTDLPDCDVRWIPTLPPVVLDAWPTAREIIHDGATTVANWRAYGSIERDGVLYGQKAHSLRRLVRLPTRTDTLLRIALDIHPDEPDLATLRANGWELVDPRQAAGTPADYAAFVSGSAMELGVAKSGYVESGSGWVSDRSACYLASGRPVLAQDTGFGEDLPTGAGLLSFDDEDSALAGLDAVRSDYHRHAAAARALAEEHFDARVVLGRLLDAAGGSP